MEERQFFSAQVFEGLLKGPLRARLPPSLLATLRDEGLDLDGPLPRDLPPEQWRRIVDVTAHALHPKAGKPEGHRRVAHLLVQTYQETLVGRALLMLARAIGPRQLALRAAARLQHRRSRRASVEELGETEFELWLAEPAVSLAFTEALLEGALEAAGAADVEVKKLKRAGAGTTLRVAWS